LERKKGPETALFFREGRTFYSAGKKCVSPSSKELNGEGKKAGAVPRISTCEGGRRSPPDRRNEIVFANWGKEAREEDEDRRSCRSLSGRDSFPTGSAVALRGKEKGGLQGGIGERQGAYEAQGGINFLEGRTYSVQTSFRERDVVKECSL